MKKHTWPVVGGIIWSLLFAAMSFYWASGGMFGVSSLGEFIARQAVMRDNSFMLLVWLTGVVKVLGAVLLFGLLKPWKSKIAAKGLYFAVVVGGAFLFLYGLLNWLTVLLASAQVLSMNIDRYSANWRLFFWEPFWMLGGVLYFVSGRRFSARMSWRKQSEP
ncbi:DUF3995 domain-containing protein [Paenibacillus mendelii]|uniref:DUF3995 domain-containing protein n=1 Tax=Paenibacillus mendelii TaxID=206163 RepID=A0ABV6JEN8_9BACL|nr:DUF3995 domain-containing protein [Paenibacillus mendelii]MCQ6557245.1 DUF3995 domain-containing protein [Paenibacillus mendelii]